MTFQPDDPRLTAYVFGELDDTQHAEVERLLAASPAAQRAVDEIRQTVGLLEAGLADEPMVGLTDHQRAQIDRHVEQVDQPLRVRIGNTSFRRRLVWVATGLAACVALVMFIPQLLPRLSRARELSHRLLKNDALAPAQVEWQSSGNREIQRTTTGRTQSYVTGVTRSYEARDRASQLDAAANGVVYVESTLPARPSDGHATQPATPPNAGFNTEAYDHIVDNSFLIPIDHPLSTFSIDVDTASYSNVRRFLNQSQLPPPDAVRIEELINYFTYDYPLPDEDAPFSVNVEVADCPWNADHRLARIGLKGYEVAPEERPASNLVFLLDVSGSMQPPNKLPLLKRSMQMLINELDAYDRVAIVVYAGASGLALDSTPCDEKDVIRAALTRLQAGGSTNGASGIQLAYTIAQGNFIEDGVNRVILATDGDFNVGVTSRGDLTRLIKEKAATGVFLSVLGFGAGNLKDATMENLADKGNGNYAYIDSLSEARKVLVEQMGGTLVTIAKDVKIQVEFNPAEVAGYRLIGYENRVLAARDFNDDTKDAGEIGAGHTVTALYEIVPAGTPLDTPEVDPLKYQATRAPSAAATGDGELMTVKLRYKLPDGDESTLMRFPIIDIGRTLNDASEDFHFAAAVASFGMLLRDSAHRGDATFDTVLELAATGAEPDARGRRGQFIELVQRAAQLAPR